MDRPIILCGLGRVGTRVLQFLTAANLPVVVVDTECSPGDSRLLGVRFVKGDCRKREVLEEAGLLLARGVLILTSQDLVNISAALMTRNIRPDVRIVVRAFNQNLISKLGTCVSNICALSTSNLTAPLLALVALTGQALGQFIVQGVPYGRRQIADFSISVGSRLRGRSIRQAIVGTDTMTLAHFGSGEERYLQDVDLDRTLCFGDRLVVCGEPRELAVLLSQEGEELASNVRWSGWLKRNSRAAWRTFAEMDLPVKIATGVLCAVILGSTLVFLAGPDSSFADALFRTVGIIGTVADMHGDKLSAGHKVYAAALRIMGAALTAVFTAFLTNYLLRARLGGALEVRRIPEEGHVIVCGLGNLGFRVVEELIASNERVVVIEQDREGKFVATARRLGAAVITGDATVREVLRQAHAATARAVIAATSNDLTNLEISLQVREFSPSKRVVVRLSDPTLADMLRDAANVRLALSIPTLAAPAFLAALFNDKMEVLFMVGQRMLAIVEVTVAREGDPLYGHNIEELAREYRLMPLALVRAQEDSIVRPSAEHLKVGDRLVAIAQLHDLERLLQRESSAL